MRFITDKEILSFNEILEKTLIRVSPISNHKGTYDIGISVNMTIDRMYDKISPLVYEPMIDYEMIFSISSKRNNFFLDLLKKISDKTVDIRVILDGVRNEKNILYLTNTKSLNIDIKEENHMINNILYIKYNHKVSGRLSEIILYKSNIENSINIMQSIWEYENGVEVNLVQWNIGDIVALVENKSKDYIILDYSYRKVNDSYIIDFLASEILDINKCVIKYGKSEILRKDDICYSRNNRIDNILG